MSGRIETVKIAQVLHDSATALVKVAAERDAYATENEQLRTKVAAYERRMEAEKLAMDMREKGMNTDVDFGVLVGALEKKAHEDPDHFRVIREAVGLTGPDMFKTASLGGESRIAEGGSSNFERFILGDVS